MQIRDELEKYLLNALKLQPLNVPDLIYHSMMYGAEVMRHHQGISPVVTFNRFQKNCVCDICSRNDSHEKIIYALCDLIFLLVRDCIQENVRLILSPQPEIPSPIISEELSTKHGIKISEIKKTKNPSQIDVVFYFFGYLATETALRDLPTIFTATIELNNSLGIGVFSTAHELILNIVNIKYLDEYQLSEQNAVSLHSFFDSLPKKFRNI